MIRELSTRKEFTDLIIELNTRKQLFDKGEDAAGSRLSDIGGDYAQSTIHGTANFEGKIQKGLPYDRITLYDTGEFYDSFMVFFNGQSLVISADTLKDTTDLLQEWGGNIIGLSEESLITLRDEALKILRPYVKTKILTR